MSPARIQEHEPTAVKREMTEKIGESHSIPERAKEIARRSGMAKGTAGATETGSEYEQESAGANKQTKYYTVLPISLLKILFP